MTPTARSVARGAVPALFLLTILGALLVQGAQPQAIRVQGYLSDRSGGSPVPANGVFSMTFAVYDAASGGAPLSTIGPMLVQVNAGLYTVELPIPSSSFSGAEAYLEIQVNGELMTRRVRVVSVPYAYSSESAATVVPGSITSQGLASGSVTADKLGIPCSQGQTLVRGASGWECASPMAPVVCTQGSFVRCYTGPPRHPGHRGVSSRDEHLQRTRDRVRGLWG